MKSANLVEIPEDQLKALVANLPPKRRAAWSKAAKAACQHLRDSRQNYAKAYDIASLMVENWWRLGLELPRLGISKGAGMKKRSAQGQNVFTLDKLGINEKQSQRCQKLAKKSKAELDEWLEAQYDEESYRLPSLRPAAEGGAHVANNSGQQEWYTPPEIIEKARKVLGQIDLDPATSAFAQKYVKAKKFFTSKEDGLTKKWAGRVWMNPPYGSGVIDKFMQKTVEHVSCDDISQAITLTNNATETKWFQGSLQWSSAICFIAGRIKYLNEKGEPENSPLQGQALLYFGGEQESFVTEFGEVGFSTRIGS